MITLGKKIFFLLLVILIGISTFSRFYNLNWGAPFYFHPDERNIASSVTQLKFPTQMNPHFFAYGSLPIYTIYFTGVIFNIITQFSIFNFQFSNTIVSFEQALIISRFFSAVFSLTIIPLLFLIGKKLKDKTAGLFAAFFAAASIGLIQFAHFGTFEMWLTFFTIVLFWLCLKLLKTKRVFVVFLLGIVLGILIATKVSHLALLPIPILALLFRNTRKIQHDGKIRLSENQTITHVGFMKKIMLFLFVTGTVYLLTNPYVMLDYPSFAGSMKYESGVALGRTDVFYTDEFVSSIPIVFQFIYIYPFLINPLLTILFVPSFFYLLFVSIKMKNKPYILLNTFYLILFLSQAFLYAKWTRYMVPTLPFMYLIIALALSDFLRSFKVLVLDFARTITFKYLIVGLFIGITFLFGISYFITAFIQEDTRIAAKNFAKQHIDPNASILTEVYDLGITPFNGSFRNITLYNFYDLDNNSEQYTPDTLADQLAISDYIILPSQRILKVRLKESKTFPEAHVFYSALLAGINGFQKIYETPCDLLCRITYLNSPIFSFEETANVFDRPTVLIFKKIKN